LQFAVGYAAAKTTVRKEHRMKDVMVIMDYEMQGRALSTPFAATLSRAAVQSIVCSNKSRPTVD
jgi:hypothetical protein